MLTVTDGNGDADGHGNGDTDGHGGGDAFV
jgi:hypothetical protein